LTDVDPNESAIMRGRFGSNWRSWATFREQWTKLSVGVVSALGVIIVAIGGWATTLKTRVVVLETQVLPVLSESNLQKENSLRIDNLTQRVARVEANIDLRYAEEQRAEAAREAEEKGKK